MFDLTSTKLLLLAVVALLVIGPKDFPVLLRTIGKYVGIIRGHAKEFRAQFDEAMRESELAQLKAEMENLGKEAEASLTAAKDKVEQTFADARQSVETSVEAATVEALPSAPETTSASDAPGAAPPPDTPAVAPAGDAAPPPSEAKPELAAAAPAPDSPEPAPAAESAPVVVQTATAQPAVERTGA